MLRFLFTADADFTIDEQAAAKNLGDAGQAVLAASIPVLEGLANWTTSDIELALRSELIDTLELKPRNAFGPLRVAITGSHISPPLFESMELLGRETVLARLRAAKR